MKTEAKQVGWMWSAAWTTAGIAALNGGNPMSTTPVSDHSKRRRGEHAAPSDRFDAFVTYLLDAPGCWLWTGAERDGYGAFSLRNKRVAAHRFAYEQAYGLIPAGMLVCHRCDNRLCVRPDHLFLGTDSDNVSDKMGKGRHRHGSNLGRRFPLRKLKTQTHCAVGHSLTPENVYVVGKSGRRCRICRRVNNTEHCRQRRMKH